MYDMVIWKKTYEITKMGDEHMKIIRLSDEDYQSLRQAVELVEFPTFADKVTSFMSKPIGKAMNTIPDKYQTKISDAVHLAIKKAFEWVLFTVDLSKKPTKSKDITHRLVSAGMGAVGGFAGGWTFLAELPLNTVILLRTIADIARSEGEDLSSGSSRLACVEVFALDTATVQGHHSGISKYYMLRKSIAGVVAEAAAFVVKGAVQAATTQAATELAQVGTQVATQATEEVAAAMAAEAGGAEGVPVLIQLINAISSQFGVTISEEFVAGMIPVIGAVGGATVNYTFTDHFQRIAHGHFTVRRLERVYGADLIESEYGKIRMEIIAGNGSNSHE